MRTRAQPAKPSPTAHRATPAQAVQGAGGKRGRTRGPSVPVRPKRSRAPADTSSPWVRRAATDWRTTVLAVHRAATSQATIQIVQRRLRRSRGAITQLLRAGAASRPPAGDVRARLAT